MAAGEGQEQLEGGVKSVISLESLRFYKRSKFSPPLNYVNLLSSINSTLLLTRFLYTSLTKSSMLQTYKWSWFFMPNIGYCSIPGVIWSKFGHLTAHPYWQPHPTISSIYVLLALYTLWLLKTYLTFAFFFVPLLTLFCPSLHEYRSTAYLWGKPLFTEQGRTL